MLRIGLTGGIGSGKSTVAARLQQLGATLVDTDAIARQLTLSGGAAIEPIRTAFGADFIDADGALNRVAMRALAFSDRSAKRRLEAILHPLIGAETERQAKLSRAARAVVFDVPLLVESGRWRQLVDKVLVVDCREETQLRRVVARSGWAAADVQSVIAQQASRALRRTCADAVIFNDTIGEDQLADEVRLVWQRWTADAA